MIEDAMDEFRDQMRRDVLNLHMEMLKQFQIQQVICSVLIIRYFELCSMYVSLLEPFYSLQTEVRAMLQHYSVNEQLIAEIERLKEENRRLKKKF